MLKDNFSNFITTAAISLDQNSPEIGFWSGLALMVGGAAWAVYKSLKRVPEIKEEYSLASKDIAIRKAVEDSLSDEDIAFLVKQIKKKRNWDYVKAYIGPVLMEAAGITIEVVTHVEMNNRFEVIAGELAATTVSYGAYRKRVANIMGEDQEKALYYGKELKQIEVQDKDTDGNVIGTHTESYIEGDVNVPLNPFTVEFSTETTDFCTGFKEYDMAFLKVRQEEWNIILDQNPAVFFNEVLRALGIREEILAYRRAGWLNKKWYKTKGDGYIDFRATPVKYTAPDGKERWKYMLDFNCDGDIEDMMIAQRGVLGIAQRQIDEMAEEVR